MDGRLRKNGLAGSALSTIALITASVVLFYFSFPNYFFKFGLWPCAWFFAVPFFLALKGRDLRGRFFAGLAFGLGAYLLLVNWFIPYSVFGFVLFVFVLSLQPIIFAGLFRGPWIRSRWSVLYVPAAWVATEYLRQLLLGGFTWGMGHSQVFCPVNIQLAALFGSGGVSFVLVFVNMCLFRSLVGDKDRFFYVLSALLMIMMVASFGFYSLAEKAPEPRSEVKILAVQSNVNFREKLFSENVPEIIKNQLALTLSDPRSFSVDMIVWPETAVPTDLLGEKTFLEQLEIVPRRTGASLLTGAALSRVGRDLNGAVLLGPDGVPNGIYAKRKLVPFVEWVPEFFRSEKLRWLLGKYSYSFAVGNKAGLFCLGNTKPSQPFGVLICSEDLFGGLFRDYKRGGAGYAVELLNDGWFERDEALLLHAQNSIMSAVENRMPVVRVSNTGWTCSIDRVGRVVMPSSSEFNSAKNFLFTVYPRGNAGWRFLSGDFFCLIALGFVIIFMLFDHRRNIR